MSGSIVALTMPKWGIEMTEGTLNAWRVSAGQSVAKGDAVIDVETEKIVNTVEAPGAGTLRRLIANAGDTYPVGALLGVLAPAEVSEADIDSFIARFRPEKVAFEPTDSIAADVAAEPAHVSPIAKRIAEQLGVDLSKVKGTGRNGRISKEDVEAYAATRSNANAFTKKKLSATRATIASRLQESTQTIPHYRLSTTVVAGPLLALRSGEVSVNDLLIRAVSLALKQHRALNARFEDNEVAEYEHADIAIAVATDNGLITPVLRRADAKSIGDIAKESKELLSRARSGALTRTDLEGGTFTISNLGMFGIDQFDAIINPPQVAILAVGAVHPAVVVQNGAPAVAQVMTLTISADHRVIDGAVAAQFLGTLRTLIETGNP